jgi:hypothetical protein
LIPVILESPFAGPTERIRAEHARYLEACILDCLTKRGYAPFASHGLYPRVLDDMVATDRALGMLAGFAWIALADHTVVYTDRGISGGMQAGITAAVLAGKRIEYLRLGHTW